MKHVALRKLYRLPLCVMFIFFAVGARAATPDEIMARGRELVVRMAEANHDWLIGPPPGMAAFSYEYRLTNKPWKTWRYDGKGGGQESIRQGVTYSTAIHALARNPRQAVVTKLDQTSETITLEFRLPGGVTGGIGNGLSGSWYGYGSYGAVGGVLTLDAKRMVPFKLEIPNMTEAYSEYAQSRPGHWVPLAIRIDKQDMHFDWKFKVYQPGVWLLDLGRYKVGDASAFKTVAEVRNVAITKGSGSSAAQRAVTQAESPAARKARLKQEEGAKLLTRLLEANRAWLQPDLKSRRGLVYDYRQESPYRERVIFDERGNIMVELAASKESPTSPTRQMLYMPDGTYASADAGSPFVREEKIAEKSLDQVRRVANLATGLGWDCALTALARDPLSFAVETAPSKDPKTMRLKLQSRGRNAIFAGTMLSFTSWCYMHDVRYETSEVTLDAATLRPLAEKDLDGDGKVVAEFKFMNYQPDTTGAACPGRILGLVPYVTREGKTQDLEMDASFGFAKPSLWLLRRVRSEFKNTTNTSTGILNELPARPEASQPLEGILKRLESTRATLAAFATAPEGETTVPFRKAEPIPAIMRARWGKDAQPPNSEEKNKPREPMFIGLCEVRAAELPDGRMRLALDLAANTYWTEYDVNLKVALLGAANAPLAEVTTTTCVRVENTIQPIPLVIETTAKVNGAPERLQVEATVKEKTAIYHGHGMWINLMRAREFQKDFNVLEGGRK